MLSYPPPNDRGLYLGIWSAMRNSGSIFGGAINFSTNFVQSTAGGIAWSTYIIFIAFECTGVFFAFLLSPTAKVRRPDGKRIPSSATMTWAQEFNALWKHAQSPRVGIDLELGMVSADNQTWLMFLPAFYSFFCGGTFGTYLSLNFSVRARALSSLIVRKSISRPICHADPQPPSPSPSSSPTAAGSSTTSAGLRRSAPGSAPPCGSSPKPPPSSGSSSKSPSRTTLSPHTTTDCKYLPDPAETRTDDQTRSSMGRSLHALRHHVYHLLLVPAVHILDFGHLQHRYQGCVAHGRTVPCI